MWTNCDVIEWNVSGTEVILESYLPLPSVFLRQKLSWRHGHVCDDSVPVPLWHTVVVHRSGIPEHEIARFAADLDPLAASFKEVLLLILREGVEVNLVESTSQCLSMMHSRVNIPVPKSVSRLDQ